MQVSQSLLSCTLIVALAMPLTAAEPQSSGASPADRVMASAVAAFHRGDHAKATETLRTLAVQDVPAAETLLGTMAANGQGGEKDDAVAAAWFLRAARSGYAPAQLALADAFAKGRGVPQDPKRAMALAKAAESQNEPGAAQWIARHAPQQMALAAAGKSKG